MHHRVWRWKWFSCQSSYVLQRLRLCGASDTVFRREIDSQRQWGYGTCYIGHGPGGSTRHPLSDPLRPILFCSLDPSKHEKWMPPSPNWDELSVWRHFQNGRHGNWQNHVFAYNSASRVDRNKISVSTPIFLRVRNFIKAFTGFYVFYLAHDELPVWRHFQNGRHGNGQNHVLPVTQLLG